MPIERYPWMTDQGMFNLYCAVHMLSTACGQCLVARNRKGWLILSHAIHHVTKRISLPVQQSS
jgi:hypothetical protein